MINKNRLSSYILFVGLLVLSIFISLKFFHLFVNSNFFLALVTLMVGGVAISLYLVQKSNRKRDAARIIVQEIRRAEDIISDYKKMGSYQFEKKIIATNSWAKNIHLFVGDLDNDELDKISDLYSTGEYLDNLVREISQITLKDEVERGKELIKIQFQQQVLIQNQQQDQPTNIVVPGLMPVWKGRLDKISLRLEPIYHSSIVDKLKKIAKLK
ncbi:MAG: hypothetical protein CO140_00800 [Candidatus Moranbacteria bacterium CG_4_9_14_3_um_filter_40_7]|nr:MAG: hypothetical protein COS71_03360 [Candidatus Moranbacteria bacterium CG06_land_8_20_14_3_00_40_12]PJA88082.1 MAG: hypothetical protein CO140_00800 [Candidatus Moranbacteria bacterium CG_4_9_14_3_um_filter_40_7]